MKAGMPEANQFPFEFMLFETGEVRFRVRHRCTWRFRAGREPQLYNGLENACAPEAHVQWWEAASGQTGDGGGRFLGGRAVM